MDRVYVDDSDVADDVMIFGGPTVGVADSGDPFDISSEDVKKLNGFDSNAKRKLNREISKLATGQGGAKSKVARDSFSAYAILNVEPPPYNLEYLAKIYEISGTNYAAVNAKVANIIDLGFDWKESPVSQESIDRAGDNPDKVKKIRAKLERLKVQISEWLEDMNSDDSIESILHKVWTDYESTGNGYLEIGRNRFGQIGYIGHAPAVSMRVRSARDGYVQIVGRDMIYFRNFGATNRNPLTSDSNPNEIIHFKKYSPNNGFYGIPDIISAKNALAGNEFASRFNLDYFEHKAVPRHIIVVKGAKLGDDSQKRLGEFFTASLKGQNHRTLYVPLKDPDAEFKMIPIEAGQMDASFLDYLKFNRDEILMAHRTPITKIGVSDKASLAVARDADKTFKEQVCRPSQKVIEKQINRIISEKTNLLKFKLNELTLTDEDTQSKIDERLIRMKVITPNEARRSRGLPGYEGGDQPLELNAQARAEQSTQASGNRRRDQERSGNAPDQDGEGRATQGEGRTVG